MKERIAIIEGFRTPMGKAGGVLKNVSAHDLGAKIVKELITRTRIDPNIIDEVIIGNVANLSDAANIARVIALKAGVPERVPAFTVHRNCASGMEAVTTAANKILLGEAETIIAGGVESMSNIPLLYNSKMTKLFSDLFRARSFFQKLKVIFRFRFSFLSPVIAVQQGLTDPISGLVMGSTAENLAREFKITRKEQDEFSAQSHNRAEKATKEGIFNNEIITIFNNNIKNSKIIENDEGIRNGQNMKDLSKLKPYFEKNTGTVTVGNSSQLTDAGAAMILMSESKAKKLKLKPLGYLKDFAYAGLDPDRMGLGPVFATAKLLKKSGVRFEDIDLIEINEAFAAQVIACKKAFESDEFAKKELGLESAIGKIDDKILNVNGGGISLGHPVGMSGSRIIIHALKELRRRKKKTALATLCVGGGQGGACLLETE
jgi:acetyl-CoA C-acetyltransferase/acetyl-CoA acyltransferase|tara:strand:- start:3331 stop:4623 length:1293 start_codon:yes stop_codon:yes gene_type:complete